MAHPMNRKGFTLMEVLIVLSIIALLSTIVLATVNEGRKTGRDTKAKTVLKELQQGIDLYREENGEYPQVSCGESSSSNWHYSTSCIGGLNAFIVGVVPELVTSIPTDGNYIFRTTSSGKSGYKLMYFNQVEGETVEEGDSFERCPAFCRDGFVDSEYQSDEGAHCSEASSAQFNTTYSVYGGGGACL